LGALQFGEHNLNMLPMRKPIIATVEEYKSWLDFLLERQTVSTLKAVSEARGAAALKGVSGGGHIQIRIFEIAREGLDAAIDVALGQFNRISKYESAEQGAFRSATDASLRNFVGRLQAGLPPGSGVRSGPAEILSKKLPELPPYLERALLWFDCGLLEVTEPEVPISMTNSIHVGGSVIGSAIQQGVEGSSQNAQIAVGDINSSLAELERVLSEITITDTERTTLAADIKTIKAQLEKPQPSRGILIEAGRSIRSIVENIAASAITPQTLAALSTLTRALGLS
jgi:hypothetical protein